MGELGLEVDGVFILLDELGQVEMGGCLMGRAGLAQSQRNIST